MNIGWTQPEDSNGNPTVIRVMTIRPTVILFEITDSWHICIVSLEDGIEVMTLYKDRRRFPYDVVKAELVRDFPEADHQTYTFGQMLGFLFKCQAAYYESGR